jgi:anti-sigma regulatory factor (Ser/Thr protein kinase)
MLTQLTEDTFEHVFNDFKGSSVIDLEEITFIDPCGMVGLLELGEMSLSQGVQKKLVLPLAEDVLQYLERMDFFQRAEKYFILESFISHMSEKFSRSSDSDVLLEITPIEKSNDIHFIVGRVRERAHAILATHLHYDENAINGFIVALSEVCQNIIEHSENKGFVGIQKYHFQKLNKNIVKIAVMDIGRGFRESLSERFSLKNDIDAIEKGLLHGASRFADKGRGHGLSAVRRFVKQWDGKLSIRSGTAKLSLIPQWSRGKAKEHNLSFFPGAQIHVMLPEV